MPSWAVIELDTTPPAIHWRAVTVLQGVLVVVFELDPEEALIARLEDPDGVIHVMDVSTPGQLRWPLDGASREGEWIVRVYDDVLNVSTLPGIMLAHTLGGAASRPDGEDELQTKGTPSDRLQWTATRRLG